MDLYAVKSNSKRTHYMGVFKRKRCALKISIDSYDPSNLNFNKKYRCIIRGIGRNSDCS